MTVNQTADLIRRNAEKLGYYVSNHTAQTGTVYLTCEAVANEGTNEEKVIARKIRIADHGECYCSEDISVDPSGWSAHDAIDRLAELVGKPVPGALRAARTRAANETAKIAANRARFEARRDEIAAELGAPKHIGTRRYLKLWRQADRQAAAEIYGC